MAEPKVHIHAQFPKVVQPNTQPELDPTNWVWKQCLTFPVNELNHLELSSRPYKWMRYATGIVIGARGELGRDRETPTPMNYEDDPPADSITLYYHTTDQAKLSMFPIDPQLADSRTGTSEGSSSRRGAFCSDVEGRDETCVVTREPPRFCQAAHLLPHSKGDEYIETFTRLRTRDFNDDDVDDDIIQDIDDVRNGLFLNLGIHVLLGDSDLAFLRTPNFAMNTADVDEEADGAEVRFTLHHFETEAERGSSTGRPGTALRTPADMSTWPPPTLFHAVYAVAVVKAFGAELADIVQNWRNIFYPDGPTEAARAGDKRRRDGANADKERPVRQKTERQERHNARTRRQGTHDAIDFFDVVTMYRCSAMEPEDVKAYMEGCEEMAVEPVEPVERKGLEEKVSSWRESLGLQTVIGTD